MAAKTTAKQNTAAKEEKKTPVNVMADAPKSSATDLNTKKTVKKETVKVDTVKKEAAKEKAEDKTVVKEAVTKPAETKKAEPKAEKKAPAKRTVSAKKEIKVKAFVQYMGREVEEKEMIAAVKKAWTKATGKKVADIKSIDLYIKPEDGAVYYVVNGTDTGSVTY